MGRGVSTCATCDGFFFKDQDIMVVGGGDTAMEEALYLSRLGRKVEVVHRRDTLRASKIMQERALKNPKISFTWDRVVEDVIDPAQNKVTAVRLRNLKTGAQWETPVDGLFVALTVNATSPRPGPTSSSRTPARRPASSARSIAAAPAAGHLVRVMIAGVHRGATISGAGPG